MQAPDGAVGDIALHPKPRSARCHSVELKFAGIDPETVNITLPGWILGEVAVGEVIGDLCNSRSVQGKKEEGSM